jgi:transposase, IS5 family
MIVDRYDPVNLFELVPKLNLQFEPELAHLDRLLDDDELFNLVKADLLLISTQTSKLRSPAV